MTLNVDYEWVREQMTLAKVRVAPGEAVLQLLNAWENVDLPDAFVDDAIEHFAKLARGTAIVPTNPNERWEDARPGGIKVGDIVRIKDDAFKGELGQMHNGRKGRIVGIRYGDIVVKSIDDRTPVLDGAHYSPHHLQKLVN